MVVLETKAQDERFMRRALALAARGIGSTHPNPRVGAVVVADGRIIGEGWHERPGMPHAEVVALETAGARAAGATLYVNLEPCHAYGRTPPCTEAIVAAGIKRVVYGCRDPHPKMAGGGAWLRGQGLEVAGGVLKERAEELNRPFLHYVASGLPWVIAKAAVSLDGKLATRTRQSQWISGTSSRRHAMRLRAAADAILVGCGTLLHDNPSLTVRGGRRRGKPPLRAVACFEAPPFAAHYRIADTSAPSRLYVQSASRHDADWRAAGVEVVRIRGMRDLLRHLAEEGRLAVLVEGGGGLHASLFEAHLSNELVLFQAPMLIGGNEAVGLWHGKGVAELAQAVRLDAIKYRRLGGDLLIRGRLIYPD